VELRLKSDRLKRLVAGLYREGEGNNSKAFNLKIGSKPTFRHVPRAQWVTPVKNNAYMSRNTTAVTPPPNENNSRFDSKEITPANYEVTPGKEKVRWIQYICESTLYPYYVHVDTGETTWVGPNEGGFAVNEQDYLTFKKLPFNEAEFQRASHLAFQKIGIQEDGSVNLKEFLSSRPGQEGMENMQLLTHMVSSLNSNEKPKNEKRVQLEEFRQLCKTVLDRQGPEALASVLKTEFEVELQMNPAESNVPQKAVVGSLNTPRFRENDRRDVQAMFKKYAIHLPAGLEAELIQWRTGED